MRFMALLAMEWDVQFDPDFAIEASQFPRAAQLEIASLGGLLRRFGPHLKRPHCDTLKNSKHANMKELRFGLPDGAWRIAFAFDPEQSAILLVGGSKSGVSERQFYRYLLRVADARFTAHLDAVRAKGKSRT